METSETSSEVRVERLERELEEEFRGRVPRERIHTLTVEALHQFDQARIRDFVHLLAWRRTREQLRATL